MILRARVWILAPDEFNLLLQLIIKKKIPPERQKNSVIQEETF